MPLRSPPDDEIDDGWVLPTPAPRSTDLRDPAIGRSGVRNSPPAPTNKQRRYARGSLSAAVSTPAPASQRYRGPLPGVAPTVSSEFSVRALAAGELDFHTGETVQLEPKSDAESPPLRPTPVAAQRKFSVTKTSQKPGQNTAAMTLRRRAKLTIPSSPTRRIWLRVCAWWSSLWHRPSRH